VERIGRFIFKVVSTVLGWAPEGLRGAIADAAALVTFLFSPIRRDNIRKNLSMIGASTGFTLIFGIFRHHARNMVEIFASSRWGAGEIQSRITYDCRDVLDNALKKNRGVILVTAHVGNWERAALFIQSLGYQIHVVAGVQMNRMLTGAIKDAKERRGITVINPEGSYRKLFKALSENGIVALLFDGDIYTSGVEVEFFGKRLRMPKGAIQLSQNTGAPIIGGYCRRIENGRYVIHMENILNGAETRSLPESESLRRLYGKAEEIVRANSDQWCMFRDLWRNAR